MNAIQSGLATGFQTKENLELITRIEDSIRRRVALENRVSHQRLVEDLEVKFENIAAINIAIKNMVQKEEFKHVEGSKYLIRKK